MGVDAQYQQILSDALGSGSKVETRNSSVLRLRNRLLTFDSFPLVSARKTAWKTALREFEWFLSGSEDIADAHPSVRPWWQPWLTPDGRLELSYATQFTGFSGLTSRVNQVEYLLAGVRDHPYSRRNLISTWNTADMRSPRCKLTTCHGTVIQAFVEPDNGLHLTTYQRSADAVVGLPANWVQYWALLLWLAGRGDRAVGSLTWHGGDVHVYQCHEALARKVVVADVSGLKTPRLVYAPARRDSWFKADDFTLDGEYTPAITDRAEMVV